MSFLNSESGAVTVDWVVITAAVVGLGLATMAVVSRGVETTSRASSDTMEGVQVTASFGDVVVAEDPAGEDPGADPGDVVEVVDPGPIDPSELTNAADCNAAGHIWFRGNCYLDG